MKIDALDHQKLENVHLWALKWKCFSRLQVFPCRRPKLAFGPTVDTTTKFVGRKFNCNLRSKPLTPYTEMSIDSSPGIHLNKWFFWLVNVHFFPQNYTITVSIKVVGGKIQTDDAMYTVDVWNAGRSVEDTRHPVAGRQLSFEVFKRRQWYPSGHQSPTTY